VLLKQGHEVAFSSSQWRQTAAQLMKLIEAGAVPHFRTRVQLGPALRRTLERLRLLQMPHVGWLKKTKPDLVVISFAYFSNDPQIANTCRMLGIPYAILVQSAGASDWLRRRHLMSFQAAYAHARQVFFVSSENRDTLEVNLAADLSHAQIVDNPFTVRPGATPVWPAVEPFWKIACVARINLASKGQDLLVRVLRQPKWRARPLRFSLWGYDNGDLSLLQKLISLYQLNDQIRYEGFSSDIESVWSSNHAFLLPSRLEGNSLALIEAMYCGRVPIATNVGRAAELFEGKDCGFLAMAATVELIDDVLERAWRRRHDWQSMGQRAAMAIRERHSLRPAEDFAALILSLVSPRRR